MPLVADILPADTDLLCERCGYRLNGLPDSGNCPECGTPVADSTIASPRRLPAWEDPSVGSVLQRWRLTSLSALFVPSHFFRHLQTRRDDPRSRRFAMTHWLVSSLLLGLSAALHAEWSLGQYPLGHGWSTLTTALVALASAGVTFALFTQLTKLVALLTFWEARYWGYRLPRHVVLRALHYLSVHFLPTSLLALLTVAGWRVALQRGWLTFSDAPVYLYVISGLVVLAAGYVFGIYVLAMRRIMYANV